ncbi:MAG TPA: oligosaccharide flippase family protein [Casimicrobiaceae bacterium]|nr:oligosaccharide flippase family protein [Casimicrobiaceae bacterium]
MTSPSRHGVHRAAAKGAGMMIVLRLGDRLISVVSFSVLARLLTPVDYGIFALALSVIAILALAGDWGLDSVVVQRRGFDRSHYDTAWTVRLIAGAVVLALVCIAAAPAARIFAEPRIGPVLCWLALGTFIASFENIGTVDFMKTLAYQRELVYRLTIRVIVTSLAIALAFVWRSYWALVAAHVVASAAMVALSYWMHPFRPRLSLSHASGMFWFTRWLFLRNVFQGINDQAANIILGRGVGVGQLPFYTFARDLSLIVATDFYAPVRRALFPAYASVSDDLSALKRLTLDSSALMMLIGLPMSAGLAVVAPDLVPVLLGERWLQVTPLLQIFCISACIGSGIAGAPVLYVAMGRPDTAAKLAAFRFVVLVTLVAVGVSAAGTLGAAWAMVATACITQAVNWRIVGRSIDLSFSDVRRYLTRPIVASAMMVLAVLALQKMLPDGHAFASSLLRLVACTLTGALVYAVSLLALWRLAGKPGGAERHILDLMATAVRRVAFPLFRTSGPLR